MKIALYSRPQMKHPPGELRRLIDAIINAGLQWTVNDGFAEILESSAGVAVTADNRYHYNCVEADMAVSYGGDGTFLDCVKRHGLCGLPVLGINSGRLGFLANVPKEDAQDVFKDLAAGRYTTSERTLIEAEGDFDSQPEIPFAFNEFSLQRSGTGMISIEAFVDGEMVATYWGDGVLLSTPAGSTAYSLSLGGPVVAPECGCFVLTPIAPHNLTMRPVVVPDTSTVSFRVRSREGEVYAALDSFSTKAPDRAMFTVRRSEKSVFLVELQNISFYDTLRNKMMWGLDRREDKP